MKRYCPMCDVWMAKRTCPDCGMATETATAADPTAVRRTASGAPEPVRWERWPEDEPAEPLPTCGLCRRQVALAPGRSICASCAHFPLD